MIKLLLAAALAFAGATAATGASAQSTLDISLKGFCNTFALNLDGFGIYGTRSGCGYTVIDGGASAKIGKNYLVTNDTNDSAEIFSWYFTPPKNNRGKFYLYEATGTTFAEVTAGKYVVTGTDDAQRTSIDATKTKRASP
jgi:hypothetical protein